jgi:hypothetical protein
MSGSIVKLNASSHQTTQELLPWFVLGTLDESETALVREHLGQCTQCQADLELQRKVQAVQLPQRSELDVESALAKLRPRLLPQSLPHSQLQPQGGIDRRSAMGERWQAWRERIARLWMPWAMGLQTAALATLCIVLWHGQAKNDENNVFHVLGADVQGSSIVVMFKPQTSEQELRRILQTSNARLAGGPTVAGAYLLNVADAQRAEALAALHREPAVVMAESLAGGERR